MGLILSRTTETTALCVGLGLYACMYLYVKLNKGKCHNKKNLEGKTIIVTGANSGIGFETALDLAKRNGRVILACRNLERGEAARNKIVQLSGNTDVVCRRVDLSVMSSIRKFVDVIKEEEGNVDILINNAGVLNLLKRSRGRVVNVGSSASVIGKVDCDNLRAEKEFSQLQYHSSKTANLLFTKELARREPGDVLVCYVHPGVVRTDAFRNMPLLFKILAYTVFRVLTKSPEEGAQPVLFCALDDSVQTGGYYIDCAQYDHTMWVPKCVYDTGLAKKLWETTERILSECG
ncbi:retinol dehydrogenase 11-like isoform X2 [Crassostrea angulata]|uniref:retinol dehydrogenase 11-like isoform X2 n=1 Tax=Magallana angulata TaxID=2784310 RepID=UPI0022B0F9EA|nr:retinol dehydrogenase 11-like isoform X2 [Crassostrea angulata]